MPRTRSGVVTSSRQENASKQIASWTMAPYKTIGFIGLGVMGEPICRNLVKKSGAPVIAFDLAPEPLARLRAEGATVAGSVAEVIGNSEIVFLCLPSAKHV